jgi:HK97 family phage major capsid protein
MENEAVKIGAAINKGNRQRLSEMKDHAKAINDHADAMLPQMEDEQTPEKTLDITDAVVSFGGAIKAVQLDNGDVKLGGYLVRFSDENDTDLEGDFFTKNTDFGDAVKSDSYFHHCIPLTYQGRSLKYTSRLPEAKLNKDELGVFAEIVLGSRNEYEKLLAKFGLAGKLNWSSATAPNLVTTKRHGNGANEITRWPLGLDATLTTQPAEPMNHVIPLKSLSVAELTGDAETDNTVQSESPADIKSAIPNKENKMEELEIQKIVDAAVKSSQESLLAAMKAAPAVDTSGDQPEVVVTLAEGDKPFKSLAEQFSAIKTAELSHGRNVDQRLLRVKAILGANETVPADGGYLLDPTLVSEIIKPMNEVGPFSSRVRRLPVGNNSNYGWINGVDETSRIAGSRWGGVLGYWLGEGASKTSSAPKFRRINWELKKIAVLMYATDELLADSAQFNAVAKQSAGEELNFMVNDAILNGDGIAKPLGIMQSGSRIFVARDTASKVLHSDVLDMWARLGIPFRKNAEWFITPGVEAQLNQLYFTGTTSVLSPFVGYTPEGVMKIMGKPVTVTEFNPALNSAGDILLADMSQYLMWGKGEAEFATSIHVAFLTDQSVFRWVLRVDGQPAYDSALTPYKGSSTTSPFVVLGAATTTAA